MTALSVVLFLQSLRAVTRAADGPDPPRKNAPPRKAAPPARHGRDTRVIDDAWTFRTDPSNMGETQGWAKSSPTGSQPIQVPSLWTATAAPGYSGFAWYWRVVDPPGAWMGQTVRIRFEAAAETADVWLNGEKLGVHHGGATPFEFDITKTVKIGTKNLLAVRLNGVAERGAGLWQGVLLMAHDEAYISDIFPSGGPLGNLVADIELYNSSDKSGDAVLDARVLTFTAPNSEVKKSSQTLSLTPKRNMTHMLINIPMKRLLVWSPASPNLYFIDLAFHQEKDVLDTAETTIGLREFDWKDGAITVNGAVFSPRSVAPDLTRPIVIATDEDRNAAHGLLKKLKERGVNVVYLDAPPPALLALADSEGLLVVEGARHGLPAPEEETELLDLIRRDRAHACILGWNLRSAGASAVSQIRKLDATRFLLVGTGSETRLYPPHVEDPQPGALPQGLLAQ